MKKSIDKPPGLWYTIIRKREGKPKQAGKEIKKMIKMYAGGWDCRKEYVREWIAKGQEPDGIYGSYEEACEKAYHDADVAPDESIWFVYEDGKIELFEDW